MHQSFTHVDARTRWDSRIGSQKAVLGWPGYTEPSELDKAVDKLVAAGVIDSPERSVELLLIKMAGKV